MLARRLYTDSKFRRIKRFMPNIRRGSNQSLTVSLNKSSLLLKQKNTINKLFMNWSIHSLTYRTAGKANCSVRVRMRTSRTNSMGFLYLQGHWGINRPLMGRLCWAILSKRLRFVNICLWRATSRCQLLYMSGRKQLIFSGKWSNVGQHLELLETLCIF